MAKVTLVLGIPSDVRGYVLLILSSIFTAPSRAKIAVQNMDTSTQILEWIAPERHPPCMTG
jgi:hypothetical protein